MKSRLLIILAAIFCISNAAMGQTQLNQALDNYWMGKEKYYNDGTVFGKQEAQEYFQKAIPALQSFAKEGYGEACAKLGEAYALGFGVNVDFTVSENLYRHAMEYGYEGSDVYYGLGDILVFQDKDLEAEPYYQKALEIRDKNEIEARGRIAYINLAKNGEVLFGDIGPYYDKMIKSYSTVVRIPVAVFALNSGKYEDACELLYGIGWLNKCIETMYANGIRELYGKHVNTATKKSLYYIAMECVKTSSNEKGAEALYYFALTAHKYNDRTNDNNSFVQYNYGYDILGAMTESANRGYAPAYKQLGDWYANGTPAVTKNLLKARQWYAKAKEAGIDVPEI